MWLMVVIEAHERVISLAKKPTGLHVLDMSITKLRIEYPGVTATGRAPCSRPLCIIAHLVSEHLRYPAKHRLKRLIIGVA
jgi:hypothetical protein